MAACTGAKDTPRDPVEHKTKAEVKAAVQAQADEIAKLVGAPLANPKVEPALCLYPGGKKNDGSVFVMQGTYHITLPADQHLGAGTRVRDSWKAAGWKITEDTTKDKTIELAATSPAKYTVRLGSSDPAIALVMLVQSTCYRDPDKV